MDPAVQFPDPVIDRLEMLWGDGFLSPGGPVEVHEIVAGLDLRGKRILDIGCGTAGPAIVLAAELGAGEVVGLDIEARLLDRAARHVERASLARRIRLQLVEPGQPLPFPDGSFDVVFSKDSIFHIADKQGLFGEVARLLPPTGVFAASDWLAHEDACAMPQFARYVELRELKVAMVTAARMKALMRQAGLRQITALDRSAEYADLLRADAERIDGPLRSRLAAAMGADRLARWERLRRACAEAVRCGGLRPTRLRGHSPKGPAQMDKAF
ncbi:MAG: methyltransferase domain-containing protein [Pseudomonadota bacterium]|nr:methyltransferase domain-containing protein [Pseudomonadota bacterium]